MPMYALRCPCGGTEGMASIKARGEANDCVPCFDCGELRETHIVPVALVGLTWPGGKEFKQIGKTFNSAKEMEKWAHSNDMEPVSPSSTRWNNLKLDSLQANDDEARTHGFRNADDKRRTIDTQTEELLDRNIATAARRAVESEKVKGDAVTHTDLKGKVTRSHRPPPTLTP